MEMDLNNAVFVINSSDSSREIHVPTCRHVSSISKDNAVVISSADFSGVEIDIGKTIDNLKTDGYDGCYFCMREHHTK